MDMFDPKTQNLVSFLDEESNQTDMIENCFYLAKFNRTSYWHCVWLSFNQIEKSTKLRPYLKRMIESTDFDEDKFSRINEPESILAVHHRTGKS